MDILTYYEHVKEANYDCVNLNLCLALCRTTLEGADPALGWTSVVYWDMLKLKGLYHVSIYDLRKTSN